MQRVHESLYKYCKNLPSIEEESNATTTVIPITRCLASYANRQQPIQDKKGLWPGRASIECIKFIELHLHNLNEHGNYVAIRKSTDILPKKRKGNMNMPTL